MPRRNAKHRPSAHDGSILDDTTRLLSSASSSSSDLAPGSVLPTTPPPPVIAGESFTLRAVLVGLAVGTVICFSNMYFGLQTGWVSTMTMPASLMGFGIFRLLAKHLDLPFSPVENVLVQTVAGSMAIMPLGCGFVGVVPAMNYLLKEEEGGPVVLGMGKMVLWALGLCYFGVVFAVPLRRQVIIRERLKFPSGFSTAVLIGVLHGQTREAKGGDEGAWASLVPREGEEVVVRGGGEGMEAEGGKDDAGWKRNLRLLLVCFLVSGFFTFATYFLPVLRNIPVFGSVAASTWLWTLNPSLAYVGQGIIMGPATTLHMLLGAVVGWGMLSPLAKYRGWAPAPVEDWEHGSKGWIVWISLAIMLADSIVSLGYLALRSTARFLPQMRNVLGAVLPARLRGQIGGRGHSGYTSVAGNDDNTSPDSELDNEKTELDAPEDQQISDRLVWVGLALSIVFCIGCIHIVFGDLVPLYATVTAVFMALVLSIMGVRALGETDLNPVSGISKLAQLFFAFIIPQSNKSSVLINLVAGAVVCAPFVFVELEVANWAVGSSLKRYVTSVGLIK